MELNSSAPPVNLSGSEQDEDVFGWRLEPIPLMMALVMASIHGAVAVKVYKRNRHDLEPLHIFWTEHSGQLLRVLSDQGYQATGHLPADQLRAVLHRPVVHLLLQDQHLRRDRDVSGWQVPRPPPPRGVQGESHAGAGQGNNYRAIMVQRAIRFRPFNKYLLSIFMISFSSES